MGLPGRILAGTAAAGGIALINSAASLAGLIGPVLMGGVKQWTGSISIAVLVLAALMLAAALLILAIPKRLMAAGRCDDAGPDGFAAVVGPAGQGGNRAARPGGRGVRRGCRAAADLVRNMGRMVLALEQALAESARVDAREGDKHGV